MTEIDVAVDGYAVERGIRKIWRLIGGEVGYGWHNGSGGFKVTNLMVSYVLRVALCSGL